MRVKSEIRFDATEQMQMIKPVNIRVVSHNSKQRQPTVVNQFGHSLAPSSIPSVRSVQTELPGQRGDRGCGFLQPSDKWIVS